MPIFRGKDSLGSYYTYGKTNKRYYYIVGNLKSRLESIEKVKRQRRAIKASQNKVYNFID